MSDERNTDTFQIVYFDEGEEKIGPDDDHRLVCNIKGGGKIAIWGSEDNRYNIETVLNAVPPFPCTVECDTLPPEEWAATRHGHTHWVPEDFSLRVL